jgi:hypothetical protein
MASIEELTAASYAIQAQAYRKALAALRQKRLALFASYGFLPPKTTKEGALIPGQTNLLTVDPKSYVGKYQQFLQGQGLQLEQALMEPRERGLVMSGIAQQGLALQPYALQRYANIAEQKEFQEDLMQQLADIAKEEAELETQIQIADLFASYNPPSEPGPVDDGGNGNGGENGEKDGKDTTPTYKYGAGPTGVYSSKIEALIAKRKRQALARQKAIRKRIGRRFKYGAGPVSTLPKPKPPVQKQKPKPPVQKQKPKPPATNKKPPKKK